MTYTGTLTKTRHEVEKVPNADGTVDWKPKRVEETVIDPLSRELRVTLGALMCAHDIYTAPRPDDDLQELRVIREAIARELEAVGRDISRFLAIVPHIHTENCADDDCPIFERGYETAQETVGEWYTPERHDFP